MKISLCKKPHTTLSFLCQVKAQKKTENFLNSISTFYIICNIILFYSMIQIMYILYNIIQLLYNTVIVTRFMFSELCPAWLTRNIQSVSWFSSSLLAASY